MPGVLFGDYWEAQLFELVFKKAEGILNSILLKSNNTKGDTEIHVQEI